MKPKLAKLVLQYKEKLTILFEKFSIVCQVGVYGPYRPNIRMYKYIFSCRWRSRTRKLWSNGFDWIHGSIMELCKEWSKYFHGPYVYFRQSSLFVCQFWHLCSSGPTLVWVWVIECDTAGHGALCGEIKVQWRLIMGTVWWREGQYSRIQGFHPDSPPMKMSLILKIPYKIFHYC